MELSRLLQRQVKKILTEQHLADPKIREFLTVVNDSYVSFERDKELLNHAFGLSEDEYQKLYENLKQAYELEKISIEKLKAAIREIDQNNEITFFSNQDEILVIVDYLNAQIVKRKETEADLSRTLQFLTTLLSKLNSAILIKDEHGKIRFVNQLYCDTFAVKTRAEDMVGKDYSVGTTSILFKQPYEFVKKVDHILSERKPVFTEELELTDGRILERDYVPIFINGEFKGHLWDYTDITQRKASERKLVDLTNLQNAILNGTDYSIIYTDSNGTIRSFNRGAEHMLGYAAEELIGNYTPSVFHDRFEVEMKALELSVELGKDIQPGFEEFVTKCRTRPTETNEWTYIKKKGDRLPVLLSVSAIRNSLGEIIGYLGIAQNIAEQKKAQEALKESEERYRNIVEK